MNTLMQDIRYGLRMLGKAPGPAVAAIAALALGIGANMAIFTVADSILLRPLPYHEPDRLVMVWETNAARGVDRNVVSAPNFFDWREQSESFEDMGAFSVASATLMLGGEPQRVVDERVAAVFLLTRGVPPCPPQSRQGRFALTPAPRAYKCTLESALAVRTQTPLEHQERTQS